MLKIEVNFRKNFDNNVLIAATLYLFTLRTKKGMCVKNRLRFRIYDNFIQFIIYYFIFIVLTFLYARTDNNRLFIFKRISLSTSNIVNENV